MNEGLAVGSSALLVEDGLVVVVVTPPSLKGDSRRQSPFGRDVSPRDDCASRQQCELHIRSTTAENCGGGGCCGGGGKVLKREVDQVCIDDQEKQSSFGWPIGSPFWHWLALQLSCPIFTLCHASPSLTPATMSSCKSAMSTEIFARSLHRRLQQHISRGQHEGQLDATTFPPSRVLTALNDDDHTNTHKDELRDQEVTFNTMRFWSETNLARHTDDHLGLHDIRHQGDDDDEQYGRGESEEREDNDSDLFFDFDIGSPEESADKTVTNALINQEEIDDTHDQQDNEEVEDDTPVDDNQRDQGMANLVLRRGHSCDSVTSAGDKASTFYGSASSGLCSDLDQSQAHVSMDGLEWASRHEAKNAEDSNNEQSNNEQSNNEQSNNEQSSHTVAASEHSVDAKQIVKEANESSGTGPESSGSVTVKKDVDEPFSIYSGDSKHTVANSKLNELLALLDKDRSVKQQQYKPQGTSPRRSVVKKNSREEMEVVNTSSPANFSFLSSMTSGPTASAHVSGSAVASSVSSVSSLMSSTSSMTRSDSTPELSAAEKAAISASESPKPRRRLDSATSTGPGPVITNMDAILEDVDLPHPDGDRLLREPALEQKMRRASSLKSGKTPPGTPGRRKIVRFADVFGLDLADVKTFLDEVPKVPRSAYSDLRGVDLSDIESESDTNTSVGGGSNLSLSGGNLDMRNRLLRQKANRGSSQELSTSLVPMFNQPGSFPNFFDLLRDKKVCVENAYMAASDAVRGTIRVQNLSFNKSVSLRYTTNEWATQNDFQATYMQGSCDGFSDKFTFTLTLNPVLAVGQRLQFCVKYDTDQGHFWDNNGGRNYVFQCLSDNSNTTTTINNTNSSSSSSNCNKGKSNVATATSAVAINMPRQVVPYHGHGISHSPSALASDEPWMNFL